jgi:hypothetical protein
MKGTDAIVSALLPQSLPAATDQWYGRHPEKPTNWTLAFAGVTNF